MEAVNFVDIPKLHESIREELHQVALSIIDNAHYIGGADVKNFEAMMAKWLGVDNVCGVSNGTSAAFAVLKSFGIKEGDEVLTTVHTAIATAEAITLTGAKPVFCDLESGYFFLSAKEVEKKITPRTKAIVPVHLYGQPADLSAILDIGKKHGLPVIEDCAQAQGARFDGKYVGTLGDAATFSFFPSKNLGGFGDGGAFTIKDAKQFRWAKMFSNHGREQKYLHEFEGINSRLDALQAALLNVCLPHLDEWNAKRRQAAAWYEEAFDGVKSIALPKTLPSTEPIYHVYVVMVDDREALQKYLNENKIGSGIHYPLSLNLQPAYASFNQGRGSFPVGEYACDHVLSLPMHPCITKEEVFRVAEVVKQFLSK